MLRGLEGKEGAVFMLFHLGLGKCLIYEIHTKSLGIIRHTPKNVHRLASENPFPVTPVVD